MNLHRWRDPYERARDERETLHAYIVCALWSSTDPDTEEPLDDEYGPGDLADETRETMRRDVADFLALVEREGLDVSWWSAEQLGHDFWLTRNGHGAGFWDRGQGETGERLSALARPYGEAYLYVGDDGRVYAS